MMASCFASKARLSASRWSWRKCWLPRAGATYPQNKLIDLLWPEPSAGDGQKAFDITVHRLRRLLGCDEAVQVTARSVSFNSQLVWVDAWALERRLAPLDPR